jgi:hypothetical protein
MWTQAQWQTASTGLSIAVRNARPWLVLITDLLQGLDALRGKRDIYLTRNADETEDAYLKRLDEAEVTNIFAEALSDLAAKPFAREIRVTDADASTLKFVENVDGDGNHLHVFAYKLLFSAIAYGVSEILVEYPDLPEDATLADERAAGGLTWTLIKAPQVLMRGDGYFKFAYSEPFRTPEGNEDTRLIIREYRVVGDSVSEDGEAIEGGVQIKETIGIGGVVRRDRILPIERIPVATVILGEVLDDIGGAIRPPLLNAAHQQIALYRRENALRFAERMTAFPMLVGRGISPQMRVDPDYPERGAKPLPVIAGPHRVLYAPAQIGAGALPEWLYLEPSAASLKFLAEQVEKAKGDLREAVRQPLVAGTAGTTQVASIMASQRSSSALQVWARLVADCIEQAFVLSRQWVPGMSAASVSLYTDFDIAAQSDDTPKLLFEMEQKGRLTLGTLYEELRRRNVLGETFDAQREESELGPLVPPDGEPGFGAVDDPTTI